MARRTITKSLVGLSLLLSLCQAADTSCKNLPGDYGWPTPHDWAQLNQTVGGRLIATIPQASICHPLPYYDYDATACTTLREAWDLPQTYELKPAEIMNPYFQNQSCDPYTPTTQPCELGNYAVYSINVTGAADVIAGIQFAKAKNVRLVIRNTGHDYMGKSTGKGALSLWTHNLKTADIMSNYTSTSYRGPSLKLGAGVIGGEAYEIASSRGYRVVGGTCASVGIAGGYTSGGGHSLLNGKYGMAADNVLEWEVVTASGQHLTATPTQNSDLYWALSGGGAGTFGVVLSMTTKLHPDGPIGGAALTFNDTTVGNEAFWDAVGVWFVYLPNFVDGPNTVDWEISNSTFSALSFTAPDSNGTEVATLLAPFLAELVSRGIPYNFSTYTAASYVDHYVHDVGPLPYGGEPPTTLFSSRILPRATMLDPTGNAAVIQSLRAATEGGDFFWGCHGLNVKNISHPENAVLPAWRDAIAMCIAISFWDWTIPRSDMLARKEHLVDVILPSIDAATPGSGTYLNEVDSLYKGDWKKEFYGVNYARLLDIKAKYDPDHFFWAYTAIGSDFWTLDGDGRLCAASS
ncbi:putative FAD-dependent isoamyl alcohol oxidase [Glonium stellatum]|uniref:Putative FAD-dependent isoamyl alcohol oxidase n=1 Tax=Glonium stellatum TaxID=574774 RepID=A0A8E2ESY1_9PEZI|nr:putative FAD-dependent isoamyl alcohol oxidase [Glonium stellatum]